MEKLITSIDRHGRMLVPAEIRERLNIRPGDKVNLEIYDDEVKIINADAKYLFSRAYLLSSIPKCLAMAVLRISICSTAINNCIMSSPLVREFYTSSYVCQGSSYY
jgi:AbrB family looped-hinge helix DNA binding protein